MTTVVAHKNIILADTRVTMQCRTPALIAKTLGSDGETAYGKAVKIYTPPKDIDPAFTTYEGRELVAIAISGEYAKARFIVTQIFTRGISKIITLIENSIFSIPDTSVLLSWDDDHKSHFIFTRDKIEYRKFLPENWAIMGSGRSGMNPVVNAFDDPLEFFLSIGLSDPGTDSYNYTMFDSTTREITEHQVSKKQMASLKKKILNAHKTHMDHF